MLNYSSRNRLCVGGPFLGAAKVFLCLGDVLDLLLAVRVCSCFDFSDCWFLYHRIHICCLLLCGMCCYSVFSFQVLQLGCLPDMEGDKFNLTPVDFVAKATLTLKH